MGKESSSFDAYTYVRDPFLLSVDEVLHHLETNQDLGLRNAQVQQYQQKYGRNEIEGDGSIKWYSLLIKQVSNAMIMVNSSSSSGASTH